MMIYQTRNWNLLHFLIGEVIIYELITGYLKILTELYFENIKIIRVI